MKTNAQKIAEIRENILNQIKDFFAQRNITSLHIADIYPGSDESPIISEGEDDYDTYTLDEVEIQDRDGVTTVLFSGSSCDDSIDLTSNDIDVETLSGIWDWFTDYEDSIDEYLDEEAEAVVESQNIRDTAFSVEIFNKNGETRVFFGNEDGSGAEYPANNKEELKSAFGTYIDNYLA